MHLGRTVGSLAPHDGASTRHASHPSLPCTSAHPGSTLRLSNRIGLVSRRARALSDHSIKTEPLDRRRELGRETAPSFISLVPYHQNSTLVLAKEAHFMGFNGNSYL